MADNIKWKNLASLAYINIDWHKMIDDIYQRIRSLNIVNARGDDSSDEDQANNIEENFNL